MEIFAAVGVIAALLIGGGITVSGVYLVWMCYVFRCTRGEWLICTGYMLVGVLVLTFTGMYQPYSITIN